MAVDQDPTALELARRRIKTFLDGSPTSGTPLGRQHGLKSTARDDLAATSARASHDEENEGEGKLPDALLGGSDEGDGEGRGAKKQEGEKEGEWLVKAATADSADSADSVGGQGAEEGRRKAPAVHLLRGNFRQLAALCESVGVREGGVDGILLDIGVSSMQVREGGGRRERETVGGAGKGGRHGGRSKRREEG